VHAESALCTSCFKKWMEIFQQHFGKWSIEEAICCAPMAWESIVCLQSFRTVLSNVALALSAVNTSDTYGNKWKKLRVMWIALVPFCLWLSTNPEIFLTCVIHNDILNDILLCFVCVRMGDFFFFS